MIKTLELTKNPDRTAYLTAIGEYFCRSNGGKTLGISSTSKKERLRLEELRVYAHINNGGVSFEVTNEKGPTIEVKASHFGNQTNHIKLHVDIDVLRQLADMFYKASTATYSEEYVCAAKVPEKSTGDSQGAI